MTMLRAGMKLPSLLYLMDELAAPVKYHRGDLMIDAAILASAPADAQKDFVWQVRESGTQLNEIAPENLRPIRTCAELWPDSSFYLIRQMIQQDDESYTIYSMTRDELFERVGHETKQEVNP